MYEESCRINPMLGQPGVGRLGWGWPTEEPAPARAVGIGDSGQRPDSAHESGARPDELLTYQLSMVE